MTDNNIIKLSEVKPKTRNEIYKRIPIKLRYDPKTQKWQWEIRVVTENRYYDDSKSDTEQKALRAAQKYIDKHELGK